MNNNPSEEFINPSINRHYDLYVIRKLLIQTITHNLPSLTGILVDIGCGKMPYRSFILQNSGVNNYIGVDWPGNPYHSTNAPDLIWDGKTLPIQANFADTCLATEVFEHLANPVDVAREIYRVLRPNGSFFLTVPFFWPFHEIPFDEYRFTPFSLLRILKEAGFCEEKIEIGATGGWYATLAQVITLTVTMEISNPRIKKIIKRISLPLIHWLIKNDTPPAEFKNHSMALGLFVIAKK